MRRALIPGLLLALASPVPAQENLAPYDAPVVVVSRDTSMDEIADLNGDGVPDAIGWFWKNASPQYSKVDVRVHLGQGDGTFVTPGWVATLPNPKLTALTWELEAGNINGDAFDDFVLTLNDEVSVYITNAAGTPSLSSTWTESFPINGLVVADFDQDGLDDIAVGGAGVRLYLNSLPTFPVVATHPTGADLFGGDLDGDGDMDLLAANGTSVELLFVHGATIVPGATLSHGITNGPMVTCGDVTGDGFDDIVVFSMDETHVLMEQVSAANFVVQPPRVGGPATDLADIDGDGDLDGVCCGGNGPGPPTNIEASTFRAALNDGGGKFDIAHSITGLGAKRLAGAVDADLDGDVDLVAGRVVMFNRESFHRPPQPDFDLAHDGRPLKVFDRDGDGDPDVVRDASGTFEDNDGCGAFTPASPILPPPPAGDWFDGPGTQGDFDDDGDIDLIVAQKNAAGFVGMRMLWNAGGGDYSDAGLALPPGTTFALDKDGVHGHRTVTGDANGDGHLDVLAGNDPFPPETHVWLGDGAGSFTYKSKFWALEPIAMADFDGDGKLDVFTAHGVGGHSFVHFGVGDGTFGPYFLMPTRIDIDRDQVAIADLDADSLPDLMAIDRWAGGLDVWMSRPNRTFVNKKVNITVGVSTTSETSVHVQVDDLDDDGDPDVLMSRPFDGQEVAMVLLNDGLGDLTTSVQQVVLASGLVDADGDGDLDAIGRRVVRHTKFHVPDDGFREQYGANTDGLGGMGPTLGAAGPFRVGETIQLRLTGTPGASWALMTMGTARSEVAGWPAPELTAYAYPPVFTLGLPLSGVTGDAGSGGFVLPATVPPTAAGGTFTFQAFVLDQAAPSWWTQTNGLELHFE